VKRCFYFWNMSFNSKALTWDGEAYCALAGANSISIYGSIFGNKCYINTSMTNAKWHTSFLGSTLIVPLSMRCCPPNQFFLQLFKHVFCPIYIFSFNNYHNGYNIFATNVMDFVLLMYYLDWCKKTNVIRGFHFIDTPLLCINII
jgi:hypothetical protein